MNKKFIYKMSGYSGIIGAIFFLVFWFSFLVLLPFNDMPKTYSSLILHQNWVLVNSFQILTNILFTFFFIGFYYFNIERLQVVGFIGFTLLILNSLFMAGIGHYETFIWPVITKYDRNITDIFNGPIYKNPLFLTGSMIGYYFLILGYIFWGIAIIKNKLRSKILTLGIIIGVLVFGFGSLTGTIRYVVQSVGLVIFSFSLISFNIKTITDKSVT